MVGSAPALADLFLGGVHGLVLDEVRRAPEEVAREVGRLVGAGLRKDAQEHWNLCPRERTWVDDQAGLLALARVPCVEEAELAAALADTVRLQRIDGKGSPLEPELFAWMMQWAPDSVYEGAKEGLSTGWRFLRSALWSHPDERALRWMVDWFATNPITARFAYSDMRVGWMRSTWDAEQWSSRVHALCDADLADVPFHIDDGLPAGTSVAQVRMACTYAKSPVDSTLRAVARNVRAYASGEPALDMHLFWWDAPGTTAELLRWILELAGPPGARAAVVDVAFAAGRIDALAGDFLAAELPRPEWADGDVAWEIDEAGQWVPRSDNGLEEGTVTVLEVLAAQDNWLRTRAVWYRWDDSRAGNLLPEAEFERRFRRLSDPPAGG